MKNISENLKRALEDDTINIVKCFKFTLLNGTLLGLTEYSKDIKIDGLKYASCCGLNNLNSSSFSDITCSNSKIVASLDNIDLEDNFLSTYDFSDASIEIFIVDHNHLEYGKLNITSGFIDSMEIVDDRVFFSIKGVLSLLEKSIGETYSPLCRANFCDRKCSLNLSNYTFNGSITTVISYDIFYTNSSEIKKKEKNYFKYGYLTFNNGKNSGKSIEIKQSDNGNITLNSSLRELITVGDNFTIICGCDRKFETCCSKFNNALNFRGEPDLPRTRKVYKFY